MTSPDETPPVPGGDLTAHVLTVDGVARLFAPPNATVRVVGTIGAAITGDSGPRVHIAGTARGAWSVSARIGVRENAAAPDTARAVADALLQHSTGRVFVEIAHIDAVQRSDP